MADPTAYERNYGFANYQAAHPSDPLPGNEVDAELDAVEASAASLAAAIEDIRRSDGALQNEIVTEDSLDPTMALALSTNGALALSAAAVTAAANAASATASAATATTQAGIATAAAAALAGVVNPVRQVRVTSTATVTVSNPGTAVFDGVTLANGDRVLLKDQSTPSQNGIYDFNGASSAMTRSADSDASAEMFSGLQVVVSEGTVSADTNFILTTNAPITLATTSLVFARRSNQSVATSAAPSFDGLAIPAGSVTVAPVALFQNGITTTGFGITCQYLGTGVSSNSTIQVSAVSAGVQLTSGATAWAAVSDERLKTKLDPFTTPLSKIATLRSGVGRYVADLDGPAHPFLIAQDVQKVLPEAVERGDDGYLVLRYTDVIPLLVAAIQELKAEVDTLKSAK